MNNGECSNGANSPMAISEGLAVFVDLENISWLTQKRLFHVVDHLSKRYGPLAFVRVYANPTLAGRFHPETLEPPFEIICVDTTLRVLDDVLIGDALRCLAHLPRTVALLTGDGDFTELLDAISRSRRKPVVVASMNNINRKLFQPTRRGNGDVYVLGRGNRAGPAVTLKLATSENQIYCKVQDKCATKARTKKKAAPPPTTFATSSGIYMRVTPAGPPPNQPRTIQGSGEYLTVPPIAPSTSPTTTTGSRKMSTSSPPANRTSKVHHQAATNPSHQSKPTAPSSPAAGFWGKVTSVVKNLFTGW